MGWYTKSYTTAFAGSACTKSKDSNSGEPSMPSGVAFSSSPCSAAARGRSSHETVTPPHRAASAAAFSGVRAHTVTRQSACASASAAALAAPPAPSTSAACPAGAKPRSRRLSTTPGPSVLYPTARPFRKHTVFTAPQEAVHGSTASSSGRMRSFRGMVTLHPSHAPRRPCTTRSSSVSAVTVTAS